MPRACLHLLQKLDDLCLGRDVEGGRGLVGDEEFGVARECGSQGHALAHAA